MPVLNFDRRVRFSPEQMMSLVSDMKAYPDFISNCIGMEVTPSSQGHFARMEIAFGPINQAYTSRVTVDEDKRTIAAEAVDGPFSHLDSLWRFEPDGEGALVHFNIDFGFNNRLVAAVAEPAFAAKQEEIMDAFMDEAERRFG